jgi:hypothetical protein
MNRDSITHDVYQCGKCKAIWDEEGIGRVEVNDIKRVFCRTCGSESLQKVNDPEEV